MCHSSSSPAILPVTQCDFLLSSLLVCNCSFSSVTGREEMEEIELNGLSVVKCDCGESRNGGNKKGDNKDRPHTSASDSPTHKCCFVHLILDTRPNLQSTYVLWFKSRIAVIILPLWDSLEIQGLNNSIQYLALPQKDSSLQLSGYLVEYFITYSFPFATANPMELCHMFGRLLLNALSGTNLCIDPLWKSLNIAHY